MAEEDGILKRIKQDDEFFKSVIDFIPPEHYGYDDEIREVLRDRKHTLVDDKLNAEKRSKLTNKSKSRLARLDDRQCRTNSQIFAFLADRGIGDKQKKRKRESKEELHEAEAPKPKKKKNAKGAKTEASQMNEEKIGDDSAADSSVATDRQQLLVKLQAKLDELRAKRGAPSDASRAMDYEEKKRLRRRLSKAKLKERRRLEKQTTSHPNEKPNSQSWKVHPGQAAAKKPVANGPTRSDVKQKLRDIPAGDKRPASSTSVTSATATKRPAVIDKDGRMVFSKFDFAVPGVVQEEKDRLKKASGKDYKRLLEKQERLQSKLQRLEDADNLEGAKRLKEKTQWEAVTQRAKGMKVKDDPNLLKKNLKRKEKRKQHSKKKWDVRNDATHKKQVEQQQKRRENIQTKKTEKKDKKLAKARKKGRLV